MSRGVSINDDIYDDFHQEADDARLQPYKEIIKQVTITDRTELHFGKGFVVMLPGKLGLWRRFWLFFFLGIRTELTNES